MDIAIKLADDCCKYGKENEGNGSVLARTALHFGTLHNSMEREREALLKTLADQVFGPLRAMITSAPLEDARHLTHRYERLRQEVESQVNEVVRRQLRSRDAGGTPDNSIKLQHAESKLSELKSAMSALGREATAAMLSVEDQQQKITFQRLLMMVDAERTYHRNSAAILDQLHAKMILEKQHGNLPESATTDMEPYSQITSEHTNAVNAHDSINAPTAPVDATALNTREGSNASNTHEGSNASNTREGSNASNTCEDTAANTHEDSNAFNTRENTPAVNMNEGLNVLNTHEATAALKNDDDQNAVCTMKDPSGPDMHEDIKSKKSGDLVEGSPNTVYFIAEVLHPFDAQSDGELSLSVGDYVVVRRVLPDGWSEGECKGKAGWFPSAYIERRDKAPASKVIDS
ncbi:hypothetical protein QJS10_CPA10g01292 [Acorus calamus]|uniref:SH3 domain-containing protein n=1 Tax=Acorus calamus TaxID=4465 RepID=A0AAV9E1G5_ACOCL|nr:hypothetical protein QJS10_CPA10g01292 [Acorus calamus]